MPDGGHSSIRLDILETSLWNRADVLFPSAELITASGFTPSWFYLCLSKVVLFIMRPLVSATPKTCVLSLEISRYVVPIWSYNCFRPRHHLGYLASTCFCFRWVRGHLHSLTEYCLPSAIQPQICTFHLGDRHFGFVADVDVRRYRKWHH